jgi:hypothetical protein
MTAPGSYRRKKSLGITIMAGLAFVSVGLATPAMADVGQDQDFYRLLTEPGRNSMVIWNFPLVRSQGIAVCQRNDGGETPYQAFKDIQSPNGPYTLDDAISIATAAETIYCPWHGTGSEPGWASTPTPISWRPVYPPLAWYPESRSRPEMPPPGAGANW